MFRKREVLENLEDFEALRKSEILRIQTLERKEYRKKWKVQSMATE